MSKRSSVCRGYDVRARVFPLKVIINSFHTNRMTIIEMNVRILLVFGVSVVRDIVAYDVICCPRGQFITKDDNKNKVCWEPVTNRSTPVSLTCKDKGLVIEDTYKLDVNEADTLIIIVPYTAIEVEPQNFCVGNYTKSIDDASVSNSTRAAIVCSDAEESMVDDKAMASCMIVSVVFLTLTALIYIMLPEVRDLQGKSIINFCISQALGLTCLAIMNLLTSYSDMTLCAVRGFLTYFFLIVSFFWTNAISFQILRCMRRPFIVDYGWREFSWYALYAWGSGALVTIALAIVNFYPGDHQRPGIGLNHCWFFDKKQQWYYMYSVMTILITANICMFYYTSRLLWRHSYSSTHIKALKHKFYMTMRLFVIMGVPWIFEMIGSLMPESIVWVILDFVNILQGPLVFLLLVVFRRRVVKALHKRGMLDCISDRVEKYLAVGNDEEENAIQHTMDIALDEKTVI